MLSRSRQLRPVLNHFNPLFTNQIRRYVLTPSLSFFFLVLLLMCLLVFTCVCSHSYVGEVDILNYPRVGTNKILNIVPQGQAVVVERLGKFHKVHHPGWFVGIPFIDKLAYVHDLRELAIRIDPQRAITKDNVTCDLGGNVYCRFTDPFKGAYGIYILLSLL